MKASNWRVWYSVEKLMLDEEGFTKARLMGENGRIVEERMDLKDGCVYILIRYQVWEARK